MEERDKRSGKRKGRKPKPPKEEPDPKEQTNLTDPDSRIMRKSKQHEYRQAYNAQAVVDADGSQLILGSRVSQCASDRNELQADIGTIPSQIGQAETVLADSGYANGKEVSDLQKQGVEVLVATGAEGQRRAYDFRPPPEEEKEAKEPKADWLKEMQAALESEEGRRKYGLRKQTVEPVFGIIKSVLGFTQFQLRGLSKVALEWDLVSLAYNCKRLHRLQLA
uniref:Transposase n=1 Tax=Magnetococcus massalia (strain MO-1) TaxID=451514 RepID=A0A1S7LN34_MAGMO